ncbi:Signal transduction histidine kinase [Micromonospora pattaloongensis]|uniref:histidine kinase n=1 Tax=Micromonospora pattaloongensis TaxID=405436 RepID=A0A1H3FMQ3_9ACTN|nr:nitrate- and nitrite sensing domain-containing protein [Micromonospora pattaloongensis]SDX92155.1 Signal transduction histidine kinase [Micromonospora pattaloongensis]
MNTRNWSIRSKIVAMVAVPIAALLALWIFAITLTVDPALRLLSAQTMVDELVRPGELVVAELQKERRLAVVYLAGHGEVPTMAEQRARTDEAIAGLRRRAADPGVRDAAPALVNAHLDQMLTALEALPSARGFIDRREMDRGGAIGLYNGVIDSGFRLFAAVAVLPDEALSRAARALVELSVAGEVLGRTDALLAGAFTAGRFGPGEYNELLEVIGTQRFLYASAIAELPADGRSAYQRLSEGDDFVALREMEDQLLLNGRNNAPPPVPQGQWQVTYDSVHEQLRQFELGMADDLAERSKPVAFAVLTRLALAGLVGFAAVVTAIVISVRVGRSLVRRLTGLRAAALDLAGARLPDVVGRLRRGEDVDVAAEVPSLEYGTDEIGQLGHAFSEVQRTAVQSAVDEATVRHGLKEVFLNIARRSQTLLHRQLAVLDKMERRATDPAELRDLFLVDHMATRMRRHAEDLVILAGAAPGRGWRNPVPMVDVIRGAISEVEDYARVDLTAVESVSVAGRAVGDVIHLLAELIENATAYSPPQTRVQVTGQLVPNGYAIEIEDRGLGMTPDAIEDANRRLVEPPDFDPARSAQLGLFVVAQLGARHGVQVTLRVSPYGGITAVVLVPADLVVSGATPVPPTAPAGPAIAAAAQPPSTPVAGSRPTPTLPPVPPVPDDGATQEIPRVTAPLPADGPGGELQRRIRTASRLGSLPLRGGAHPTTTAPPVDPTPAPPAAPARSGATPASPGGPARSAAPSEIPVGPDGLPRRIRQGSLAPQLRQPAAPPPAPEPGGRASSLRSPQQVRSIMSALQDGTARGRRDAAVPLGDAPPPGAAPLGDRPRAGAEPAAAPAAPPTTPRAADPPAVVPAPRHAAPADAVPASDGGSTDSGRDV